jgi:hypothetical protein
MLNHCTAYSVLWPSLRHRTDGTPETIPCVGIKFDFLGRLSCHQLFVLRSHHAQH